MIAEVQHKAPQERIKAFSEETKGASTEFKISKVTEDQRLLREEMNQIIKEQAAAFKKQEERIEQEKEDILRLKNKEIEDLRSEYNKIVYS